jgi:hypothetical protein
VVNDGKFDSDPAHLSIVATPHTLPIAEFDISDSSCLLSICKGAPNDSIRAGDDMFIAGTKSTGTDGPLTFKWTVLDPNGATVATKSDSPTGPKQDLTPALVGTYSITLVVNDGYHDSNPLTQQLTVGAANHAPIAVGAPTRTFYVGDIVTLSAAGSSDPDGDGLTYHWMLSKVPPTSVSLSQGTFLGTDPTASFQPDIEGVYEAWLTVSDGRVESALVVVSVRVYVKPWVDFSGSHTIATGATVPFYADVTEGDSGQVSHVWSIKSGPSTDPAQLVFANPRQPYFGKFTPTENGVYVISLTVTDAFGNVASGEQTFNTVALVAKLIPQQSTFKVNETLGFQVSMAVAEPYSVIMTWSYDPSWNGQLNVIKTNNPATYAVQPLQAGDLPITLTITNNNGGNSSTATYTANVTN